MKRILFCLTLTSSLLATPALTAMMLAGGIQISPAPKDLSYKFYNQRISLSEKSNQLAVVFQPASGTRSIGEPNYIKLEQVLQGAGSRDLGASGDLKVDVKPLGSRYALLTLPTTRALDFQQTLQQRLQQSYVQTTLPVFQRQDASPDSNQTIILHDEMIVSFEPGTSKEEMGEIFKRYDAEIVRPLRFTKNRYLVRSRTASGAGLLSVIDQMSSVTGVQSVSPNFIQALNYRPEMQALPSTPEPQSAIDSKPAITRLPKLANQPYPDSLLPYQWHLDSRFRQIPLGSRSDIHAPEAWAMGNRGKDVLVAVIDSVIEWDHPNLKGNLYEVPQNLPDLMPGERYGWDFSGWGEKQTCLTSNPNNCAPGDPDTRLSVEELAVLKPHFQKMFQPDAVILKDYAKLADQIHSRYPKLNAKQTAAEIRNYILSEISYEFHGTMVAGVVAAKPQETGVVGVAPNAKILPVRVFGLDGEIKGDALLEAIAYAAARGAEVINMSLGSLIPTQAEADEIFAVLDQHPNLVIVASAGNENVDGAGYPAAIPGVLSVGATNMAGQRTSYSNYGRRLDVTAPGGDTSLDKSGGILTTGGTWISGFWEGMTLPTYSWGPAFDPTGRYVQVQGTSFSSPVVAGVVALMKGEDPQHKLSRDRLLQMIETTASYQPLTIPKRDENRYRLQKGIPSTPIPQFGLPVSNPGIEKPGEVLPINQYYFGRGLVNAAAAVEEVKKQVRTYATVTGERHPMTRLKS